MDEIEWSNLPEELVGLIANHLSNNIELCRIRSICKPWRSEVATKKHFLNRFGHNLASFSTGLRTRLFPTTFFRVTLPSSCSSKGWLIRTRKVSKSRKNTFLSPLSSQLITPSDKTLDLLKFAVSEISQCHEIKSLHSQNRQSHMSSRVVFLDNIFFAVNERNRFWCCKKGEEKKGWTRIKKEVGDFWGKTQVDDITNIILHKGHVYALDLDGVIWWVSLSQLSNGQYAPSTPLEDDEIDSCIEKRLVEYCGDLCISHRFCRKFRVNGEDIKKTIGFKVYKMDDLAKWVMVSSLGDKALIVAVDSCFTVVVSEYYGCLANSIYFTETESDDEDICKTGKKVEDVKVFKLDDGSIQARPGQKPNKELL